MVLDLADRPYFDHGRIGSDYPYSREWGYGPSGGAVLLLVILLALLMFGVFEVPGCRVETDTTPRTVPTTSQVE